MVQAAVDAGKIEEDALLKEPHISLEDYLKHSEITKLIGSPIEVIAFSEEEGVRCYTICQIFTTTGYLFMPRTTPFRCHAPVCKGGTLLD